MLAIWQTLNQALKIKPRQRSKRHKKTIENGFAELFIYLFASLLALSILCFNSGSPFLFGAQPKVVGSDPNIIHIIVFFVILLASFGPLVCGFYLQARMETNRKSIPLWRKDVVSPGTLVVSTVLIGSILTLAWYAGEGRLEIDANLGMLVTLGVIGTFLVMIASPHIAKAMNDAAETKQEAKSGIFLGFKPATIPLSWADSALVRLVAPVSGATHQKTWWLPYAIMMGITVPLSALGYVLSAPYGLIPIGIAMLIAAALGRRWAWVEEDRETASRLQSTRGREIHIGFANDLKDEALLGYASFFILVPLALFQLQGWSGSFIPNQEFSTGNPFADWLGFFGAELAKAVPFVDWWEIYEVDVDTAFDPRQSTDPLAKHLTFGARAMVDLVIMAALLQAIGIWQRCRTQNRLYDAGQIDAFDPFTEVEFFERGMYRGRGDRDGLLRPKKRFRERVKHHVECRRRLRLEELPYSRTRLGELREHENEDVREGAAWLISEFQVLAGPPREQLRQFRNFLNMPGYWAKRLGHSPSAEAKLREDKIQIERILTELLDSGDYLRRDDVGAMLEIFRELHSHPEFEFARILCFSLLGKSTQEFAPIALSTFVLEGRQMEVDFDWRERITAKFGMIHPLFLGQASMRCRVYEALSDILLSEVASRAARGAALDILSVCAKTERLGGDRAQEGRACAQRILEDADSPTLL